MTGASSGLPMPLEHPVPEGAFALNNGKHTFLVLDGQAHPPLALDRAERPGAEGPPLTHGTPPTAT